MPSSSQGDPMDTSRGMGPPAPAPANGETGAGSNDSSNASANASADTKGDDTPSRAPVTGAAAAVQQPKVVQTAFIHKLYNMLEDQSIQHLISWSSSNESFLISPSSEFSKVLASYFKHTNVSSFVRQLNMYGFHKVSDVFHSGSPDSPLWEFKHGQGNFKRGDLAGLREIKRRASRHTLIHRDSFSNTPSKLQGTPQQPPPPPAAAQEPAPDNVEARVLALEQNLYDMHHRLARAEEAQGVTSARCQVLCDSLVKAYQYTADLSGLLMHAVPDPESYAHRTAASMQKEVERNMSQLRSESLLQTPPRFGNDPNSVSPRQLAQDDQRRGSLRGPPRPGLLRPIAPSAPVRPFDQGGPTPSPPSLPLPAHSQPSAVQPPIHQHPLSNTAYLPRRHTSADIRTDSVSAGQPHVSFASHLGPPAVSGTSSAHYPSSPSRSHLPNPQIAPSDPQLRDSLTRYSLGGPLAADRRGSGYSYGPRHPSRPSTPPYQNGAQADSGWSSLPGARPQFRDVFKNTGIEDPSSAPATRRSSLIHTILNPAETAERDDEEDDSGPGSDDWRKRKRIN